MSLVCPSCEQTPDLGATLGASCASCGATLVRVADSDPLIGATLDGRFKIVSRLGAGAMGVVYRATQLSIGRDVAVKVMTGMEASSVKRFFREAKIASTLSHPNTVPIIEFGQSADGRVYLAMELVKGRTLLEEMQQHGALASRRICHIGTQLCDALEAAHKLTIVHRDLKPENVMIALDGSDHVKILDFGIARLLDDSSSRVTRAGLSAGTPNYMAPEVLGSGADAAPPQDMYALGVMLGELALGSSLWTKSTTLEALYLEKTTNKVIDKVPARLRPLIQRLLDTDPEKRPTASETRKLLRELDRVATDPVGVAPTMNPIAPVARPSDDADDAPLELAPLVDLQVVDLSERTNAPAIAKQQAALSEATFGPPPEKAPTRKVEPLGPDTINQSAGDDRIELDSGWRAEKAARQAGRAPLSPLAQRVIAEDRKRKAGSTGFAVAVVLVLAVAGGGVYLYIRSTKSDSTSSSTPATNRPPLDSTPTPAGSAKKLPPVDRSAPQDIRTVPSKGVSIRIVGASGTPITIDGSPGGKTPVSLKKTATTRPIMIGANGKTWQVIPDRDQTIDITK